MKSEYIEQRHGGYYVAGTRISLDSVVCSFNEGQSPEAVRKDFPSLKLSQVYGAIAFYLDHRAEIDKYLEETWREFEGNAMFRPITTNTRSGLAACKQFAGRVLSR